MRRRLFLLLSLLAFAAPLPAQQWEILAVRYGTIADFPLRGLMPGAPEGEALDIAMVMWVLRDAEHVVLFDTGFFREAWLERFTFGDFERPDEALARAGIRAEDVTDVIISHAHWDHMGGIALFPNATLWLQEAEYTYYTGAAWQPGGRTGGIDRADIEHLLARNMAGQVRFVAGDDVEILPGIRAYIGARHTFASQYLRVETPQPWVLASDNAYLYRNLHEGRASATFSPEDREANIAAQRRMEELAGDPARVVPGHDVLQFERFPTVTEGVVRITAGGGT